MKIIAKNDNVKKGDKFESPNGDYKYVIKDIDYSSTPNMVQMMYADSKSIHKGDLLSSPTGIYTYEITSIDYSVNPPLVYFKDLKKDNKYEYYTYTLFLPRLYKIIKDNLYKLI